MKRRNYLISSILTISIVILVIFIMQPIQLNEDTIIAQNKINNQIIEEMELDEKLLLHDQKATIINNNLTYIQSFSKALYTMPSENQYLYQRSWKNYEQLDYNTQSTIETRAYLFIDQQKNYHVMINYLFTKQESGKNYIELQFSNYYHLNLLEHRSYLIYQNNEYLDDIKPTYDVSKHHYEMPIGSFKQAFKKTITKGFYHFKLTANAGYESSIFSFLINIFEQKLKNNQTILLGFNGFRNNPNTFHYIPNSLNVYYLKEEN